MDFHTIEARGISVTLDLAVGHIADLAVVSGGRTLRPLHRAPWIDEPAETLPAGLIPGQARLSGDFLCAPFSASDVEPAPLHGWPSNSRWRLVCDEALPGGRRAVFRLERPVMGAGVTKAFTLRDGHPFLYQEHAFEGGAGALPAAHHTMTVMAGGGRICFSPKRLAFTPDKAPEPDPARGRSLLAYPARSADPSRFPSASGEAFDLGLYRTGLGHEDFVTLVEADHGGPGWTAVARNAERDLVLVLKDPAALPVTMLWISNGGRYYAPWNGRHRGVLGIEDGRTAIGHSASLGDNPLAREGIATAFRLGGRVAFRQITGALPLEGHAPPVSALPGDGGLELTFADAMHVAVPFDGHFLSDQGRV